MSGPNVTITLLHTNDLHSHFEETSKIAGYISDIRTRVDPDKLLVVDCGDFLDRARIETEGTQGAVNRAIIEKMGYDAVMLGNNEGLSYDTEQLDELFHGMSVPIVCANMKLARTGAPPAWMIPTLTVERAGIRIGLIGLTPAFRDYYDLLGWESADPLETLREEAERLRQETDVLIVMSHLGLKQDERIAVSVEGIDLILGGHTHHLLEVPLYVGQTAICAAGKFGFHIGHLELELGKGNKLIKVTGGSHPTDDYPPNAELDKIIDDYRRQARQSLDREVAHLSNELTVTYDKESPLPTLLASAIRRLTDAEIGLVNAGQLLESIPAGTVTEETIHAICPSPINPCLTRLTGRQILRTLEESLLPEFQQLEIRGFGFRGRVLGMLCLDGLEVAVDPGGAPYHKITEIKVNGLAMDQDRLYSVGTLDMFTFGVGYLGLKEGQDVRYFLPDFIRHVLSEALNDEQLIEGCRTPRWRYLV
ncbi:bifunctional metallophosphatase/5'-nucleotidase [Cohnella lupini]|uniref:2',3'-cyclic-nucleotide 2'-phosphodiesterase (5'-nucleotidase family) n=1 Tax=Cohnella lupini TaxID=1294267 RepID=A0A3D9IQH5_9BACL|nr:bifunctional UDP-sugar hydrolase/5'-nucleotidase [Cohnella lupini]RED64040.1 2',3'-cyclic-nucleotide 2'-phosphodiesterase (5'-nucleotidase family) [Cohnella lupini]